MPRVTRPLLEVLENRTVPTLMGNTLFPADNPWNQDIANAPVAANSATLVASIGLNSPLHPDFGTTYAGSLNGIPYNVVSGSQPKVNIIIDNYADESDLLPIPIPANAVIEGDPLPSAQNTGDRHLIVYDYTNNIVYETWNTHRPSEEPDGQWHADSEAVWNLNLDTFRTAGFTSADAAGLPILPGLVREDEVLQQGAITHALRFTVPETDNAYVYPASHEAGVNNASLPPMGERFRLKASVDISGFSAANQVILTALKDYGMIVADNGSPWYLSGAPSSQWNDSDLHALTEIPGSDFEAVNLTPEVASLSPAAGVSTGGTTVTITGLCFSGGAGMTQVFFGTTPATNVQVLSDTKITCTAPTGTVGQVNVTVESPYGTSAVVTGDVFTYTSPVPLFEFSAAALRVSETAGLVTFTVERVGSTSASATIHYAAGGGTAQAGVNYTAASGTLTFSPGQATQTFQVAVLDDGVVDGDHTVNLTLSNPSSGTALGAPASLVLTIGEADGTANQRFVADLYVDLLHRAPDAGGLANWSAQLDRGASRAQVVQGIENSGEHLGLVVNGLYQTLLGRTADPGGLQNFVQFLQNGGTVEQVSLILVTSGEYASENASSSAFIQSLYTKVLGRIASQAEVSAWLGILPGLGRAVVANAFLGSYEFRSNAVEQMYGFLPAPAGSVATVFSDLLQRPVAPSTAEINGWANSTLDLRTIETLFAGGGEFYGNA
jgi:hypothetical protein